VLAASPTPEPTDRHAAEDRNLLDLARLTVAAALARRDSVGAHFRSDDRALDDQAGVGAGAATAAGVAADHPTHELEAA
jgi:L-aspartate oxidase